MTKSANHRSHNNSADPQIDQLLEAASQCRALVGENPEDAQSWYVLGLIEAQLGHIDVALASLKKSLDIRPHEPDVLCNYAVILFDQKQHDEASAAFQLALKLDPSNAEAYYHYGNVLYEQDKLNEAMKAYQKTLALMPDHLFALNNLGSVYKKFNNLDSSIACFKKALDLNPDFVLSLNNIGLAYTATAQFDEAMRSFNRALQQSPQDAEVMNNMAVALRLCGRFKESSQWYRRALSLRPDYAEAWNNYGNILKDLGEADEAITCYRKAIQLKDTSDKRHNLAIALLTAGQFEEGWLAYEHRWKTKQMEFCVRHFDKPQWKGEAGDGKTLLIHAEQGLGDNIQFCRYVPQVAARGYRILLELPTSLVELLSSLKGVDRIIEKGQAIPAFDVHCPMLSLPFAMQTRINSIPSSVPYLSVDSHKIENWKGKLTEAASNLKVGLVWHGNPRLHSLDSAAADQRRSIAPELLLPLMEIEGVHFYSLQLESSSRPQGLYVTDFMNSCKDFADTAAFISNLDLVISVDTSVAHLAGALGKSVWLLNRFDSCWRWLQGRNDSPWYPTLRQFRQPQPGDWSSVIRSVKGELEQLSLNRVAGSSLVPSDSTK